MPTQRAVVHKSQGVSEVASDVPLPVLRDDYIIVKTKAVALNPTDWKTLEKNPTPGAVIGCDYAGLVEQVGKSVTAPIKVGDRVAGAVRGAHPVTKQGAFAEYVAAKGDIQARIPDSLSFEDAATLGIGIITVGQGLYQSLGLPLPPAQVKEPTSILIYGASTATGTLAVQYAKLSGAVVFATASPHNFHLVRALGADHVFDYRDPDVGARIREATNDDLHLVLDTIAEKNTPDICAAAISSKGGHYSSLLEVSQFPRKDVRSSFTLGYTAIGEKYNEKYPANQNDFEFGVRFWRITEPLLHQGKIKTHPTELRTGGFDALSQGLQDLKNGKVSGTKLVYRVE